MLPEAQAVTTAVSADPSCHCCLCSDQRGPFQAESLKVNGCDLTGQQWDRSTARDSAAQMLSIGVKSCGEVTCRAGLTELLQWDTAQLKLI